MKTCKLCGAAEELNYWGKKRRICKTCFKARNRSYYLKKRGQWIEWVGQQVEMKCSSCGYDEHFAALEFHHLNPPDKKFVIAEWMSGGRAFSPENQKVVLHEISKCLVLCANCHRILHHKESS